MARVEILRHADRPIHASTSGFCRKVEVPKYEVMLTSAARHRYVGFMSAQPSDATPHRIVLPRKIRAVRQALTPEQQAQFAAELDDENAGGLAQVVERWWTQAVLNLSPGARDRIAAVEAGTARTVPIEAVIPDFAERFEQRHGRPYTPHASR